MNPINRYFARELGCSLLLGALPWALLSRAYGVEAMMEKFNGLNPSWVLTAYMLFLLVLPVTVNWMSLRFIDNNLTNPGLITRLKGIARESSTSLHGIYRAVAGFSLVIMIPVLVLDPSPSSLFMASYMMLFGVACLFACCFLSGWKQK